MSTNDVIVLFLLLGLKHFIVDFPLQAFPYQYRNKGTYGHPGGMLHSGLHIVGTFFAVLFFVPPGWALLISVLDGECHYHIDWAKVQITNRMGWGPTTHEQFWILLGFDQLLHFITYVAIVKGVTML